jgi:hypothetical protein
MWQKGDKTHPTLNYAVVAGDARLRDVVQYRSKKGTDETIKGWNTRRDDNHFQWRGSGWLKPITSDWYVVYMNSHRDTAIIYFAATMFTPCGVDVISRQQCAATASVDINAALAHLSTINFYDRLRSDLAPISQ